MDGQPLRDDLISRLPFGNVVHVLKRRKSRVAPPPTECGLTECLRIVGGAWTANVIWYLRDQPRRFSELQSDLAGVSAKVLTTRLRRLERDGLVCRRVVASTPPTVEYELSPYGRRVLPALETIADVGLELTRLRRRSAS